MSPIRRARRPRRRPSCAPPTTCAGPGCSAAGRPRETVEALRAMSRLGQLGAALTVAAIRHGDRPGLIDELGIAHVRRARRAHGRAGLRAARPRRRGGRLGRDPVPQPPRLPRHHVRGLQGRRAGAAAEHRLRRAAAARRVRAGGDRGAGRRRGVRRARGRDRAAEGAARRLDRRRRRRPTRSSS